MSRKSRPVLSDTEWTELSWKRVLRFYPDTQKAIEILLHYNRTAIPFIIAQDFVLPDFMIRLIESELLISHKQEAEEVKEIPNE